jgi:antitoxin VapB
MSASHEPSSLIAAEKAADYALAPTAPARQVRLFRNGANQAVRIPREFEFDAQEVVMTRVGNTLVLEALSRKPKKGTAAALLAALNSMKEWPVVTEPFPNADEGMLPLDEIDLEK